MRYDASMKGLNMKIRDNYVIKQNQRIAKDVYEMILVGDTSAIQSPGEFVNVYVPGKFLPRPISVAYSDEESLCLAYKVVGEGTEIISQMVPGEVLTVLTGLGNGFDLDVPSEKPVLIGGGMGVAPLYKLAVELKKRKKEATIITGFRREEDIIYYDQLNALFPNFVTLEQAPLKKGVRMVTDILKTLSESDYDYFYACGPKPMLKAVCDIALTDGEVSLESRMACGVGQCKCCSIETNDGMKTLCKDGPVLKKNMVRW